MTPPGFFSIRWKLLALIVGISLSLWAVLSVLHIHDQRRLIGQQLQQTTALRKSLVRERARSLSSELRRQTENELAAYNLSALSDMMNDVVALHADLAYVILMDAAGIIRHHTARPETVNEPARAEADVFAVTRQVSTVREYGKGPGAVMEFIEPIRFGDQLWGALRMGFSMRALADDNAAAESQMAREVQRLWRRFASTAAIILAIGLASAIFAKHHLIDPILILTDTARQLSRENFEAARLLPRGHNDEIGLLTETFAAMTRKLESSQNRLKDMVAVSRRDETFLNSILDNLPHMIFVKDAEHLRFVRFNRAGERLLGYDRRELIGKSDFDFFPPDIAHAFVQADREALAGGELADIPEERIVTREGEIRLLHTKKIPIRDADGQPRYLLGISEDITDMRRLEDEVLRASAAEQERIAHDLHDSLGQILTGIAYKAKFIERCIEDQQWPPAEQVRRIAALANQASEQARALARGLDPLVLEDGLPLALQDLAHSLHELFDVECTLQIDFADFHADKSTALHLYRIAQEAATNAIRHGKARRLGLALTVDGRYLALAIRDDGVGFPDGDIARMGAGLRNMHYRAKLLRGILKIARAPGGGVEVICRVPLPTRGSEASAPRSKGNDT